MARALHATHATKPYLVAVQTSLTWCALTYTLTSTLQAFLIATLPATATLLTLPQKYSQGVTQCCSSIESVLTPSQWARPCCCATFYSGTHSILSAH